MKFPQIAFLNTDTVQIGVPKRYFPEFRINGLYS